MVSQGWRESEQPKHVKRARIELNSSRFDTGDGVKVGGSNDHNQIPYNPEKVLGVSAPPERSTCPCPARHGEHQSSTSVAEKCCR